MSRLTSNAILALLGFVLTCPSFAGERSSRSRLRNSLSTARILLTRSSNQIAHYRNTPTKTACSTSGIPTQVTHHVTTPVAVDGSFVANHPSPNHSSPSENVQTTAEPDRPSIPIGSSLNLLLDLPETEGVVLLKTGPLVIRLTIDTWTANGTSFTLPDFQLMRPADGEIYFLNQQGKLISKELVTLTPRTK